MSKKGVIYCEKLKDGSFNLAFYDTKDVFVSETNVMDNFRTIKKDYKDWDIIKLGF